MDEMLPRCILESIQMYLFVTSVMVLNAMALPWTLIPTTVLLIIFVFLLKWYLNAAQAVKRLESTSKYQYLRTVIFITPTYILYKMELLFFAAKSPVFGMINSTIAGLSTVRSSDSQNRLIRMFDDAQVSKLS